VTKGCKNFYHLRLFLEKKQRKQHSEKKSLPLVWRGPIAGSQLKVAMGDNVDKDKSFD